jgi:hypothetical protein
MRETPILPRSCEASRIDVRWAVALEYTDNTRELIGINRNVQCVQFQSRVLPVNASSIKLLNFMERTFPFLIGRQENGGRKDGEAAVNA